jgi:hypothetical protein
MGAIQVTLSRKGAKSQPPAAILVFGHPVLRIHRHHDIVALGFGRSRACAIARAASRSSGALFNSIRLSCPSADPVAQFCISHIRGSVARCRTSRRYCPEPCRLYCPEPCRLSKCQHRMQPSWSRMSQWAGARCTTATASVT